MSLGDQFLDRTGGEDKETTLKKETPLKNVSEETRELAASNQSTRSARRVLAKVLCEFFKQYGQERDPKSNDRSKAKPILEKIWRDALNKLIIEKTSFGKLTGHC